MSIHKAKAGLYVLGFDLHFDKVHKPTLNAMFDFISKNPIAGFIFGGDQFDNAEISHHNAKSPLFKPTGSYAHNTAAFNKQILEPLESRLLKGALRVWIEGNHDDWENQLVEKSPELQGTIERRTLLNLDKRGWQFIGIGKHFQLGKLKVVHGENISGTNHAKRALDLYACSVLYGHLHTLQSATKVAPFSEKNKHTAVCSPILGSTNPDYLKNKPTAWLTGFTIVDLQPNGNFNIYPVVVIDGKFQFAGVSYGKSPAK